MTHDDGVVISGRFATALTGRRIEISSEGMLTPAVPAGHADDIACFCGTVPDGEGGILHRIRAEWVTPQPPRPDGVKVYVELRDWWIGYYRGDAYHYVCLLPTVVIRWPRRAS